MKYLEGALEHGGLKVEAEAMTTDERSPTRGERHDRSLTTSEQHDRSPFASLSLRCCSVFRFALALSDF